jgi:hypothetical protein
MGIFNDIIPFFRKINPKKGIFQKTGIGSPEGLVIGYIGEKYFDTSSSNLYEKASGENTNTGWTLINAVGGGGGGAVDVFFFKIDENNVLNVYSGINGEVPEHDAYITLPNTASITLVGSTLNIIY